MSLPIQVIVELSSKRCNPFACSLPIISFLFVLYSWMSVLNSCYSRWQVIKGQVSSINVLPCEISMIFLRFLVFLISKSFTKNRSLYLCFFLFQKHWITEKLSTVVDSLREKYKQTIQRATKPWICSNLIEFSFHGLKLKDILSIWGITLFPCFFEIVIPEVLKSYW